MDEKNNLIVFAKIEVVLIFLFVVLMTMTALVLGYRWGYREGMKKIESIENEVKQIPVGDSSIDLKSKSEEEAEQVEGQLDKKSAEGVSTGDSLNRLKDEFENVEKSEEKDGEGKSQSGADKNQSYLPSSAQKGKFTIQLGSYPDLQEAKEFSKAFSEQGFNPMIHQVAIGGSSWYRVSLGLFDGVAEAKKYVQTEKSLFQQQEKYFITEIK